MSYSISYNIPDNQLDTSCLLEFWEFVLERQRVYERKCVEERPKPWTSDPVIQNVVFTNVYRELDEGTVYLANHVINAGLPADELFEVLVYRLFNNRFTYEFLRHRRAHGCWEDWEHIAVLLRERKLEQQNLDNKVRLPIFSMAHMTTSMRQGGQPDKIGAACYVLHEHWINREKIYKQAMACQTLEDQCKYISTLDGYGMFLAYEVVTDLHASRQLWKFDINDWANPGPGCRRAILKIWSKHEGRVDYLHFIRWLHQEQSNHINSITDDIPAYIKAWPLSLRNIEHSLCEYYKYNRAKHEGYARRKYNGT